jgi:archaeal preflagellin peptidase FlaK
MNLLKCYAMDGGFTFVAAMRIGLSIAMFGYVSYKDVKTREVNDIVWIIFGAMGVFLDVYDIFNGNIGIVQLIFAIGFMGIFALITGYLGLFGGADLLAFVVLGILCPVAPAFGFQPLLFEPIFFPLTVISNAVLIGALSSIAAFLYNMNEQREEKLFYGYAATGLGFRLLLMMTGIKKNITAIHGPPYEYPLESVGLNGEVSLNLRPNLGDDAGALETLKKLREMGRKNVWISFSLPFLLVLGIGYLSAITLGDIALWLVSHFIY